MGQQTTALFTMRQEDGALVRILWAFILNWAQWLNFASLVAWKTDMSSPLDFLLRVVADESRAGIMQLQHSYLEIQGWQHFSASFNYEWQLFISCLLVGWVDAMALAPFSSLILFSIIPHLQQITAKHTWGEKGARQNYPGVKREVSNNTVKEPYQGKNATETHIL